MHINASINIEKNIEISPSHLQEVKADHWNGKK